MMKSLMIVGLLLVLNGAPSLAEETPPVYPDVFRLTFAESPTTLDPQKSSLLHNYNLRRHFFDPLFTLRDGEVVPVLLESYRWKEPTRWEFTLKKGVLFHDSSELTTKDVLATFRRAVRLNGVLSETIKGYTVEILDDYRFQIVSPKPDSELLWNLEDIVVISHTAEVVDSDAFNSGEYLIGTGPYRLIERDVFDEFRLEAFPDYHRGAAYIKKLVIKAGYDEKKRIAGFLNDELDMVSYRLLYDWPDLERGVNITNKVTNLFYMLMLETRREQTLSVRGHDGEVLAVNPLHDVRVRQAISKALNREELVLQLLGSRNRAQIAGQLLNDSALLSDSTLMPESQDITEAKRLLSEAGYPEGFQMSVIAGAKRKNYIDALSLMLMRVGIQVKEVLFGDDFFDEVKKSGSIALFALGSGGNLAEMLQKFQTGAEDNSNRYSNSEFDQRVDDAMAQLSLELKHRKLREAHRMIMADLPMIPIMFVSNYWAVRDDMVFDPTDQLFTEAYYIRPKEVE